MSAPRSLLATHVAFRLPHNCISRITHSSKPLQLQRRSTVSAVGEMAQQLSSSAIWPELTACYDLALKTGAIKKTETDDELFRDPLLNVDFVLRTAGALRLKSSAAKNGSRSDDNPFLNPEKALLVGHLSATHSLLLNKFNVVSHHVLVVTRSFEEQTHPLTAADFGAAVAVLQALPAGGVAFFNSGPHSGASQRHKHIQVVPLPFMIGQPAKLPFEDALLSAVGDCSEEVHPVRSLPYCSLVARISPGTTSEQLAAMTTDALAAAEKTCLVGDMSYNMLLTKEFLHLIPRRSEKSGPVSINALGLAGTMFVKTDEQLHYIKDCAPSKVLRDTTFPWPVTAKIP